MVGAAQRHLEIAENHVHPAKFGVLYTRPSTAIHDLLVRTARRGDTLKTGQPIRDHLRVGAKETVKVLSRASIETMAGFIDESGW